MITLSLAMRIVVAIMTLPVYTPSVHSLNVHTQVSRENIGYAAYRSEIILPSDKHNSDLPGSMVDWQPVPFVLEIQTVPPLEGIPFLIDGRRFVTNDKGVVIARLWQEGFYEVEVLLSEFHSRDMMLEFARWGDYVFTPRRDIEITSSISMEAGFHVSYPSRLDYVDQNGFEFPKERVSTVELRNSIGDVITFEGSQLQWMQSIEVLGRDFGLDPLEVVYAVQRVIVDGSNVVNRGQQRFTVSSQEAPRIELLLYPVEFTSRDALFGFSLGRGIRLELPDGRRETYALDEKGKLQIDSMARGTYRSSAVGAPGLAIPTTFVLSRAQVVEIIVISILDIVVVSLAGTLIIAGLLIIGRPELLEQLRIRVRGKAQDAEALAANSREEDHG